MKRYFAIFDKPFLVLRCSLCLTSIALGTVERDLLAVSGSLKELTFVWEEQPRRLIGDTLVKALKSVFFPQKKSILQRSLKSLFQFLIINPSRLESLYRFFESLCGSKLWGFGFGDAEFLFGTWV